MVEFYVEPNTTAIPLGRQGENLARTIYFELSELISNYGEGTATLVCLRPSDTAPYVCETTQTGAMLAWTPTNTDTAFAGGGKCELRWVVGETLAKSIIYTTTIAPSITGAGEVPSPYKSWYDAIIAYIEANYAANGAPQEVREAIYTLLSKAAYTETGLTDELAIVQAWTAETLSVTNNLTHVTNSNTATMATQGGSYTATLTADSGYVLGTVSVTMGGEDVTATVYSSGTITIPSVTGDIVITATAVAAVSSISAVYTQSGTVYETDALDTLKADLVVTATYSDSSTATVTDYTLSGTLTEGTSTITVSYGGATTTFNVTVSHAVPTYVTDGLIARWDGIDNTADGHDSSATTWKDLVGSYDIAVPSGSATWDTDGLVLTGAQARNIKSSSVWSAMTNTTIEVVLTPSATSTCAVVAFDMSGSGANSKGVYLYSDNSIGFVGQSSTTFASGQTALTDIKQVACLYNGHNVSKALVNGNAASSSGNSHSMRHSTSYIAIGNSDSGTAYLFNGKIRAMRVYNRQLTDAELAQNLAADTARFSL